MTNQRCTACGAPWAFVSLVLVHCAGLTCRNYDFDHRRSLMAWQVREVIAHECPDMIW